MENDKERIEEFANIISDLSTVLKIYVKSYESTTGSSTIPMSQGDHIKDIQALEYLFQHKTTVFPAGWDSKKNTPVIYKGSTPTQGAECMVYEGGKFISGSIGTVDTQSIHVSISDREEMELVGINFVSGFADKEFDSVQSALFRKGTTRVSSAPGPPPLRQRSLSPEMSGPVPFVVEYLPMMDLYVTQKSFNLIQENANEKVCGIRCVINEASLSSLRQRLPTVSAWTKKYASVKCAEWSYRLIGDEQRVLGDTFIKFTVDNGIFGGITIEVALSNIQIVDDAFFDEHFSAPACLYTKEPILERKSIIPGDEEDEEGDEDTDDTDVLKSDSKNSCSFL